MNKKNKIIIILSILAVLLLGIVLISNHNKNNDIKIGNDSEISQNDDNNEETRKYEIKDLGTIECEKIELNAPIKETIELDVLSTAVGHFEDTPLYNGNVC